MFWPCTFRRSAPPAWPWPNRSWCGNKAFTKSGAMAYLAFSAIMAWSPKPAASSCSSVKPEAFKASSVALTLAMARSCTPSKIAPRLAVSCTSLAVDSTDAPSQPLGATNTMSPEASVSVTLPAPLAAMPPLPSTLLSTVARTEPAPALSSTRSPTMREVSTEASSMP